MYIINVYTYSNTIINRIYETLWMVGNNYRSWYKSSSTHLFIYYKPPVCIFSPTVFFINNRMNPSHLAQCVQWNVHFHILVKTHERAAVNTYKDKESFINKVKLKYWQRRSSGWSIVEDLSCTKAVRHVLYIWVIIVQVPFACERFVVLINYAIITIMYLFEPDHWYIRWYLCQPRRHSELKLYSAEC